MFIYVLIVLLFYRYVYGARGRVHKDLESTEDHMGPNQFSNKRIVSSTPRVTHFS